MKEFTKRYTDALERLNGDAALARVRATLSEKVHAIDSPTRSAWRFLVPVVSAAMAAAVVAVVVWPETPLEMSVRGQPHARADFIQASESDAVLDFSDGTEVVVRQHAQMRVTRVTASGADVALERGSARVAVVHRDRNTRWNFSAGPYRVAVVGTKFELKWNPEIGALEVEMDEGVVEVEGPGLSKQRVTGSQKLEAFSNPPRASLYLEKPAQIPVAAAVVEEAPEEPKEVPQVAVRTVPKKRVESPPAVERPEIRGPTWRHLATTGDAEGAMQVARETGFAWLTRSLPAGDVLLLGDTALKAKQGALARQAWLAVRERFAGSESAVEAAIRLGELSAGVDRNDRAAAKWFSRAVREAPNNAVSAPTAMGRWIEVLVHSGKTSEARKVAAEYVRRFPNGSKVSDARSLLP